MFRQWVFLHFEYVLCVLLLISRIGDVLSTWLVTPRLHLESNPIMRRLGWKFGLLTLLICFFPFIDRNASVMILVTFLMVCASNFAKVWFARTFGEEAYQNLMVDLARRGNQPLAYIGVAVSSMFVILLGAFVWLFYPDPAIAGGFWIGAGIVLYGAVSWFYGSLHFRRLFKLARRPGESKEHPPNRTGFHPEGLQ